MFLHVIHVKIIYHKIAKSVMVKNKSMETIKLSSFFNMFYSSNLDKESLINPQMGKRLSIFPKRQHLKHPMNTVTSIIRRLTIN